MLDATRAALAAFPLKNELVRQLQGAHAAFASAGYQPDYAPELKLRAWFDASTLAGQVLAAAPAEAGRGDPKIPYVFYIYLAAADGQPALNSADYFQPAALPLLAQARTLCITALSEQVMGQQLNAHNALKPAIQTLLDNSTEALRYPTLHINHPVFIGIGGADIKVPTLMQQHFARAVEASGTPVTIRNYPGLDYSGAVNPSLRDSVPFVLKALESEP